MSRFATKLAFAIASASLAMASPSHATDTKIYPGSYCQPELASIDTPSIDYNTTNVNHNGVAAGSVHVLCPITKDNSLNANGLVAAHVRVDSDGIAMVSCFLESRSAFGVILDTSTTASTTSATPVNLVLSGINVSVAGGSYGIHCILPVTGTSVHGYRINEFSPTD